MQQHMMILGYKSQMGRRAMNLCRPVLALAVPRASVSRWTRVYDDFVGSDRLSRVQNEFFEAKNECLRYQNIRLGCQQKLIAVQTKLKDLHSELRNASTTDKKYHTLFAKELQVLKGIHSLSYDLHLYEEAEKEKFFLLEKILAEHRDKEWKKAKRSHQFLLYASLLGLSFGIVGTLISIYLHEYFYEDQVHRRNIVLKELATALASSIEAKNIVIGTFLQDIAVLLHTQPLVPVGDEVHLPSAGDDDDDAIVISQLQDAVPVFMKKNVENDEEMRRLRLLLYNHRQSRDLHLEVLPLKEQETRPDDDVSPVWRTTFLYSLLLVAVPLAYSLLT